MRSKFMRVITALASVALAGLPAIRATPAEAPTIRVEDAWIRWLPAGVPDRRLRDAHQYR